MNSLTDPWLEVRGKSLHGTVLANAMERLGDSLEQHGSWFWPSLTDVLSLPCEDVLKVGPHKLGTTPVPGRWESIIVTSKTLPGYFAPATHLTHCPACDAVVNRFAPCYRRLMPVLGDRRHTVKQAASGKVCVVGNQLSDLSPYLRRLMTEVAVMYDDFGLLTDRRYDKKDDTDWAEGLRTAPHVVMRITKFAQAQEVLSIRPYEPVWFFVEDVKLAKHLARLGFTVAP